MKQKLMISIMLTMFSVNAQAQQEYLYTSNLDAYVGTWKYESGEETFILVLKKASLNITSFYGECLVGGYKHIKNGQLLVDCTSGLPSGITDINFNIPNCPAFFGDNGCARADCVTPNEVSFFFWDKAYGQKELDGSLILLSSNTINFEVWEEEDLSGTTTEWQISVPKKVVMTKQ